MEGVSIWMFSSSFGHTLSVSKKHWFFNLPEIVISFGFALSNMLIEFAEFAKIVTKSL